MWPPRRFRFRWSKKNGSNATELETGADNNEEVDEMEKMTESGGEPDMAALMKGLGDLENMDLGTIMQQGMGMWKEMLGSPEMQEMMNNPDQMRELMTPFVDKSKLEEMLADPGNLKKSMNEGIDAMQELMSDPNKIQELVDSMMERLDPATKEKIQKLASGDEATNEIEATEYNVSLSEYCRTDVASVLCDLIEDARLLGAKCRPAEKLLRKLGIRGTDMTIKGIDGRRVISNLEQKIKETSRDELCKREASNALIVLEKQIPLKEAMEKENIYFLEESIADGERRNADTEAAKVLLARLTAKAALVAAIDKRDLDLIELGLAAAGRVGVEATNARDTIEELRVARQLQYAMKARDIQTVEALIIEAERKGIDTRNARSMIQEEQIRKDLDSATRDEDAPKLLATILEGDVNSVDVHGAEEHLIRLLLERQASDTLLGDGRKGKMEKRNGRNQKSAHLLVDGLGNISDSQALFSLGRKSTEMTNALKKAAVDAFDTLEDNFEAFGRSKRPLSYLTSNPNLFFICLEFADFRSIMNANIALYRWLSISKSANTEELLQKTNEIESVLTIVKDAKYMIGDVSELLAFLVRDDSSTFDKETKPFRRTADNAINIDGIYEIALREARRIITGVSGRRNGVRNKVCKGYNLTRAVRLFRLVLFEATNSSSSTYRPQCYLDGRIQYVVGMCCLHGIGMKHDKCRGNELLVQAAECGFNIAQAANLYMVTQNRLLNLRYLLKRRVQVAGELLSLAVEKAEEICLKSKYQECPWKYLCAQSSTRIVLNSLIYTFSTFEKVFVKVIDHNTLRRRARIVVEQFVALGVAAAILQQLRGLIFRPKNVEYLDAKEVTFFTRILHYFTDIHEKHETVSTAASNDEYGHGLPSAAQPVIHRQRENVERCVKILAKKFGGEKVRGWKWLRSYIKGPISTESTWDFLDLLDRLFANNQRTPNLVDERQSFDRIFIGYGGLNTYAEFFDMSTSLLKYSRLKERIDNGNRDYKVNIVELTNDKKSDDLVDDEVFDDYDDDFIHRCLISSLRLNPQGFRHLSKKLRNNQKIALTILRLDGMLLEVCSELLRGNFECCLEAVKQNGKALKFCFPDVYLEGGGSLVKTAIQTEKNAMVLQYILPEHPLFNDPSFMLQAILFDRDAFQYCSSTLKENVDFLTELCAAQRDITWTKILEYSSHKIRSSRFIGKVSVEQDWKAFVFLAPELKTDLDIIVGAWKNCDENPLEFFRLLPHSIFDNQTRFLDILEQTSSILLSITPVELRRDPKFVLMAVRRLKAPEILKYTEELVRLEKFMWTVCREFPAAIQFAAPELKSNYQLLLLCISSEPNLFFYASDLLKHDPLFIIDAIKVKGSMEALKYAPLELRGNKSILLLAIKTNGLALYYATPEICGDFDCVMEAVKQNWKALQYASEELRSDFDIVMTAYAQGGNKALRYASIKCACLVANIEGIKMEGLNLMYAEEELKSNKAVVLSAVSSNGLALRYAARHIRNDPDIVDQAFWKTGPACLKFVDSREIRDKYYKMIITATRIQSCFRIHLANNIYERKRLEFVMIQKIQKLVRCFFARKKLKGLTIRRCGIRSGGTNNLLLLRTGSGGNVIEVFNVSKNSRVPKSLLPLPSQARSLRRGIRSLDTNELVLIREYAGQLVEAFSVSKGKKVKEPPPSLLRQAPIQRRGIRMIGTKELVLVRESEGKVIQAYSVSRNQYIDAANCTEI